MEYSSITKAKFPRGHFLKWIEKHIIPFLLKIERFKLLEDLKKSVFYSIPLIGIGFILFYGWGGFSSNIKVRLLNSFIISMGFLGVGVSFFLPYFYISRVIDGTDRIILGLLYGILSALVNLFLFIKPWNWHNFIYSLKLMSSGGFLFSFVIALLFVYIFKGAMQVLHPLETNPREHFTHTEVFNATNTQNKHQNTKPLADLLNKKGSPKTSSLTTTYLLIIGILCSTLILSFLYLLEKNGIVLLLYVPRFIHPITAGAESPIVVSVIVFLMSLFWLAGIHGSGVIGGIVIPIYIILLNANIQAYSLGKPLPHIVTPPFFMWSMIGGTGATLPLCIYMLFSKSKHLKKIAKISILPSLFNINEPLIFGIPIILNPILAIPFVITPVAIALVNYTALYFGLVNRIFIFPIFAIPTPIYAYLCTLDIKASILILIDLVIASIIYYPFFLSLEKIHVEKEKKE